MRFKGTNIRKLTGQKNMSFLLKNSFVNNVTGSVYFGFNFGEFVGGSIEEPGQGLKLFQFRFEKGRIYDFDDNYVYSYGPSDIFTLSGDISEDYYNYSINGASIVKGKTKNNFNIENFFVTTTDDTELETSLFIYSDGISYEFTLPDEMLLADTVTGQISNTSADGNLHIFSATLKENAYRNYSVVSRPTDIGPSETGDFVFSNAGIKAGHNSFKMDLDTNIGKISVEDSIQVIPPEEIFTINKLEEVLDNAYSALTFDGVNSEGFTYYIYRSSIFSSTHKEQQVSVSLEYEEGNVGTYYRVTGVNITDSGSGYTEVPTVTFDAGWGNDVQAEGEAVLDGMQPSSGVSDITITNSGIYYSGHGDITPPTVSISGGDPMMTTNAQATVITESYEKTFSECWDIYTGLNYESVTNDGFTEENYAGTGTYTDANLTPLVNEQNFYIQIKGKSFYDFDTIKAKLKITGTLKDSNTNRLTEEVIISSGNTKI